MVLLYKEEFFSKKRSFDELFFFVNAVLLVLFLFNPFFAALCALLLLFFDFNLNRTNRIFLSLLIGGGASAIASSRAFAISYSDDFNTYYNMYCQLAEGDLSALTSFGGGLEIGLPIVYFFIGLLNKELSPNLLMFITSLIISCLFSVWLNYKNENIKRLNILIAASFVFYVPYYSTQLCRQVFSAVFFCS